jgi:hypothetical protein
VTQESIARARLLSWTMAAEIWDLKIDPPLREEDLVDLVHGTFTFRAKRPVTIDGGEAAVLLEV